MKITDNLFSRLFKTILTKFLVSIKFPSSTLIGGYSLQVESEVQLNKYFDLLFNRFGYDWSLLKPTARLKDIRTFKICDLGCHIGLFPVWCAIMLNKQYRNNTIEISGEAIDINEKIIKFIEYNLRNPHLNFWPKIGAVGSLKKEGEKVKVFISSKELDSHIFVSSSEVGNETVDALTLEALFLSNDSVFDVLKISIEGAEVNLLTDKKEMDIISTQFKNIVVEFNEPYSNPNLIKKWFSGLNHIVVQQVIQDEKNRGKIYLKNNSLK